MWVEFGIAVGALLVGWGLGRIGSSVKAYRAYLRGAQVGLDVAQTAATHGFDQGYALGVRHKQENISEAYEQGRGAGVRQEQARRVLP